MLLGADLITTMSQILVNATEKQEIAQHLLQKEGGSNDNERLDQIKIKSLFADESQHDKLLNAYLELAQRAQQQQDEDCENNSGLSRVLRS